ncbi:MAG: hypothetical protein F6K32_09630 [Desertifilum sp. SIO1I2]|nr:hypothetical protein [Desertifilum sp. SIO1I2]
MSQQQENNREWVGDIVNITEAMDLLFAPESLLVAIRLEDETDSDVMVGLDWGSDLSKFLENPALFGRLTQLRVSLNREVRLLLEEWNLGVGTNSALTSARAILMERLQTPTPDALPVLQRILTQDELYKDELISDRNPLRSLLTVLLTDSDWEMIANSAAHSIRMQIMHRGDTARISA